MRAALVALVLALAAPAAPQPPLAEFDLAALEAARVEIGATGLARIELPRRVGFGYPVILDATGPASAGYYLTGELEGLPDWPVKLVVHGELVTAAVHWYVWRSGGDGSAADAPPSRSPAAFESRGNDAVMAPRPSGRLRLTAEDAAAPMEDGSWIDVLVLYTPEAKQEDAGGEAAIMELLVDLLIVHTNAVHAESGVAHRLRLAAAPIEAEPFREAGFDSSSEMLRRLVTVRCELAACAVSERRQQRPAAGEQRAVRGGGGERRRGGQGGSASTGAPRVVHAGRPQRGAVHRVRRQRLPAYVGWLLPAGAARGRHGGRRHGAASGSLDAVRCAAAARRGSAPRRGHAVAAHGERTLRRRRAGWRRGDASGLGRPLAAVVALQDGGAVARPALGQQPTARNGRRLAGPAAAAGGPTGGGRRGGVPRPGRRPADLHGGLVGTGRRDGERGGDRRHPDRGG